MSRSTSWLTSANTSSVFSISSRVDILWPWRFSRTRKICRCFAANKELQYEACAEYFKGFNLAYTTKTQILSTVSEAYEYTEEKLTKYVTWAAGHWVSQGGHPRYIALLDHSISSYKAIPGVTKVPSEEFESYFKTIGPAALRAALSV